MNQYQDYTYYQNGDTLIMLPQKPPRARLHAGIIAFSAALAILLTSVAQAIIHGVVLEMNPAITENDWYLWVLSVVPMYLFAMPLSYLLLLTIPKSAPEKQKLNPLMWVGFLFLCFALSYAANIAGQYVNDWIYNMLGVEVENELGEMTSVTPFGINLLFVGILAPVFEELFYRKAVIDRLRRYGDLPAILISGLIFGLVHGNFNQVFYATCVGILLGFIYVRTGSVLYTISIHAAFNMIGGVYTTELIRRMGENLTPAEGDTVGQVMLMAYMVFTVISLVIGTIFLLANLGRFRRSLKKGEYTLSFDKWMNALVFNPGMWAFLGIVALLFISSLFA